MEEMPGRTRQAKKDASSNNISNASPSAKPRPVRPSRRLRAVKPTMPTEATSSSRLTRKDPTGGRLEKHAVKKKTKETKEKKEKKEKKPPPKQRIASVRRKDHAEQTKPISRSPPMPPPQVA